jgi:hypothetical protein
MYSYEDRIKAVELYIKYDKSAAATVQELGYPSYKMLIRWYKEFKETGALHEKFTRSSTYTSDQMKAAVNYYLEHGRGGLNIDSNLLNLNKSFDIFSLFRPKQQLQLGQWY